MSEVIKIHKDGDPWTITAVLHERVEVWCGDPQLDYPEQLSADMARRMAWQLNTAAHAVDGGNRGDAAIRLGRIRALVENHAGDIEPAEILAILDDES